MRNENAFQFIWMKEHHFKMASQETLCSQDLVDQGRKENQLPVIEEKVKEMADRKSKYWEISACAPCHPAPLCGLWVQILPAENITTTAGERRAMQTGANHTK